MDTTNNGRMKTKTLLILLFVFSLFSCGSKKTVTKSEKKEDTNINYTDDSKSVTDIDATKQYVTTNTKERIVTMYGVHFDTVYVDGKPIIMPIPYITSKEEIRDINTENFLYRLHVKDSIQSAITLRFKGKLELNEKEINELKETTIYYQIAVLVIAIMGIILLIIYIISKAKLSRLIL